MSPVRFVVGAIPILLLATFASPIRAAQQPILMAGLERLRGFRGVMADYTFDPQHNGAHRFLVVKIKGGKPTLETLLEETVR